MAAYVDNIHNLQERNIIKKNTYETLKDHVRNRKMNKRWREFWSIFFWAHFSRSILWRLPSDKFLNVHDLVHFLWWKCTIVQLVISVHCFWPPVHPSSVLSPVPGQFSKESFLRAGTMRKPGKGIELSICCSVVMRQFGRWPLLHSGCKHWSKIPYRNLK